jgi:chemotaxis signal transduction protein
VGGPEGGEVVVWRWSEALLALPLFAVQEIAKVSARTGRVRTRHGALELEPPPGVTPGRRAPRAVVVRSRSGTAVKALAADHVDGILAPGSDVVDLPAWLSSLDARHVSAVIRLEDGRLAALLDLDALFGSP